MISRKRDPIGRKNSNTTVQLIYLKNTLMNLIVITFFKNSAENIFLTICLNNSNRTVSVIFRNFLTFWGFSDI